MLHGIAFRLRRLRTRLFPPAYEPDVVATTYTAEGLVAALDGGRQAIAQGGLLRHVPLQVREPERDVAGLVLGGQARHLARAGIGRVIPQEPEQGEEEIVTIHLPHAVGDAEADHALAALIESLVGLLIGLLGLAGPGADGEIRPCPSTRQRQA